MHNRIPVTIVLLALGSLTSVAQRLDGCVESGVSGLSRAVLRETRDRGVQDAGYSLTHDSLVSALNDQRADVRSAAAQKLVEGADWKAGLAPILRAYLAEKDLCTKSSMYGALTALMSGFAWDAKQHPGGQPRVATFQGCTPSDHPLMALNIEQTTDPYFSGPAIRISFRNQTQQTLALARTVSPTELFSVTVLGPAGDRAKVTRGEELLYEPLRPNDFSTLELSFRPAFQALPPSEDVSWIWRIGQDFDMSVPGTYRVSFGGRLDYLDTTVCSNTASVTVAK
jgi:hypothetical protein